MTTHPTGPARRRRLTFPHTYVIILAILGTATLMTYLVPAGTSLRVRVS